MRSQSSWAKRSVVMPLPGLSEYAPCARPALKMQRRTLWTLYVCNLLASVGFWFFLPLLPIFLSRRGGSATLVGAVFAAGLLGSAAIRYPAGWAADRFGTRPVMIAALGLEAVLFLAYLPHLPLFAFIAIRFLLGAATAYMIGTFDTIWSLYMTYRGATTLAVGISFATFGIPALLVSARAGALGDRFGGQQLIVGSLLVTALFSSIYPFIASVPRLIGLGH